MEKEFAEAKESFDMEHVEHGSLFGVMSLVCDDLQVTQPEGSSTLVARAAQIMDRVRALERNALRANVNRSFAVTHSHYKDVIALDLLSLGYALGWSEDELTMLETEVEPLLRALADSIENTVLPRRG